MAGTVTNNVTNLTRAEAADAASWADIGGGSGSSQNSDLPLEGVETRARRISNKNIGFGYFAPATVNLTAAGTHLGMWFVVLQPGQINTGGLELSLSDSTLGPQSGNWNGYVFTGADYPPTGGWVRAWVDLSRARDVGAGTLNRANSRCFGINFSMLTVGGTAQNCQIDRIDYTSSGLALTGGTPVAPAVFQDIATYDNANAIGIFDGDFLNGPLTLGGTSSHFEDANYAIKAGVQPLAAADWFRITINLSAATSAVYLRSGLLSGIGLVFVGTAGTCSLGSTVLLDAPAITLNSAVRWFGSLTASGTLTVNGADLRSLTVDSSVAASAVIYNDAANPSGLIDGMRFTSAGTGHGLELGTNSPTAITLNGLSFTGYAGANGSTGNEALWIRRTSGTVTITLSGMAQPSYRTDGATVVFVADPVTLTLTGIKSGSEVRVYESGTITEIGGQESVTTGSFATAVEVSIVDVVVHALGYLNLRITGIDMTGGNVSLPIQQTIDRQYENP